MPITPNDARKVDVSTLNDICFEIDKQAKEHTGRWYKEYTFALFCGELTTEEKNHVIDLYTKAGWEKVEITNSSENDERPGLCEVKLYYPK